MSGRRLDDAAIAAAADLLAAHRASGERLTELPASIRPAGLADAYAVQDALVERLCARHGGTPVGYKVACTNAVAQEALRIDRPLFGRMLSHSVWPAPVTLRASAFTTRVIECEFGLRIGADVPVGTVPYTAETVAPFVDAVVPAIEIVDHRFADWSLGAPSIAADNAIHGGWVHGTAVAGDPLGRDLAHHALEARIDGAVVGAGTGAAVLGHPLTVLAWLADELPRYGHRLRAGDLVTTGVCTDVFSAEAGSTVVADFGTLGSVTLQFS
jgi:2-keto-4-pentenoate hydratase